jgi:hypothetical protein
VLSAGPPAASARVTWLAAVVLLAAALTGAIIVAVHYRGQASALRQQLRSAGVPAPPGTGSPVLSSSTTALPSFRGLAGEVTVFSVRSSAGLAQAVVTARISGGQPGSRYELVGGDCASNAVDQWRAAGVTDARGSANLAGPAWRVSASHEYYLVLRSPSLLQNHPGPAVHGYFGTGRGFSPVQGGIAPCVP